MARPLRIELAGGVYHVTSRGDRREMIYGDDTDRRKALGSGLSFAHPVSRGPGVVCRLEMANAYLALFFYELWGQVFHLLIPCQEGRGWFAGWK